MKVIEQFYNVATGAGGRREIEMPGVLTEEEARAREPELERERQRAELREQMKILLLDEALGLDVTERKRELCDAFTALR